MSKKFTYKAIFSLIICFFVFNSLAGCSFVIQKGRRSDVERIEELNYQLSQLESTRILLEDRLRQEILDKKVRLEMAEKGLVITFVADILFDSGKAKIRKDAYPILDKVARVLDENVPDLDIGIEGHTDNEPIKYSGWKSNWELSTARALSVLHYISDEKDIVPERLRAIGFGEHHPVTSNDAKEGRQLNRRVEVVILPKASKVNPLEEEVSNSRYYK